MMSDRRTHSTELRIAADHPSLPGHFPGRPIVPGVVLLDSVLAEAARWLGRPLSLRALPQAKFLTPLLPDQGAELQLSYDGDELRFEISREDATIASGTFRVSPGSAR